MQGVADSVTTRGSLQASPTVPDIATTPSGTGLPGWLAVAAGAALFAWIAVGLFPHVDQDAWIYFTYYKEFFNRPFSFQPGHVTFGATSPLQVVALAPIYHVFGAWWLPVAKAMNFCLVLAALGLVHRASGADTRLWPSLVAAALAFETLMRSTATLFETGVTVLLVSIVLYAFAKDRRRPAIAAAGLLHLARPELALVTAGVFVALAVQQRRLFLREWAAALLPVAAYYGYMWASGAGLVPTSVVGRAILANEYAISWSDKVLAILAVREVRIHGVALAVSCVALALMPRRVAPAFIVIAPLVGLYTLAPPGWASYAPRYLVPAIPAFLYALMLLLDRAFRTVSRTGFGRAVGPWKTVVAFVAAAAAALLVIRHVPHEPWKPYTYDTILQKDLAQAVSGIVLPGDRVLMYEIQGQYYFPGHAISADGIVGREVHDFLLKRQTFEDLVDRERLQFIVTFNAFTYRRIYAGTSLVDLYAHDLTARIGDVVCLTRFCYEKVAGNPHFNQWYLEQPARDLNVGETMRFYDGTGDPRQRGQLIQWNSVYRIHRSGTADDVTAPQSF